MHDPIKTLDNVYGLTLDSKTKAVLSIKYDHPFTTWTQSQFEDAINTVLGESHSHTFISLHDAKYTLMYFVQNLISYEHQGLVTDPAEVLQYSRIQSTTFQHTNAIALSLEDGYENDTITHRTGTKSEQAYQIYCENIDKEDARSVITKLFQSELDMSTGGSTTYFHNCKRRYTSNL